MPPERGLELVGPAGAAEEREPAGPVEERFLPRSRWGRGRGAAPEAGAERQAVQRAREQRLARLHEEVRPPGAVDEGVSGDATVAAELRLERDRRGGRMVEELEGHLARLRESERPPQEDSVRRGMRDGNDELAAGASRRLGEVSLPVGHGWKRVVREYEV